MCGIYSCFYRISYPYGTQHEILKRRGPDQYKMSINNNCLMAFYRLAIVGGIDGMQPYATDNIILICNGEIYNYKELAKRHNIVEPKSDCMIIAELYKRVGIDQTVAMLDGEFAFVLYDMDKKLVYAARDITGVKPLYYSINQNDNINQTIEFASMIKALGYSHNVQHIKPRHIYTYDMTKHTLSDSCYHAFIYRPNVNIDYNDIYTALKHAVEKRIMQADRPIGFLLSGGFDSSLVLSIAMDSKLLKHKPDVFTFGFNEQAPDVISAKIMVKWLRSKYGDDCINWHLVIMNFKDGINAIDKTIKALETFDTTTIRASVPMWLISSYIANNTNIKVVLSGEGSDELFAGYLYFKHAPNIHACRSEIIKLLNNLYYYDNLRADRSTADHGLEVRPPFLDKELIDIVLSHSELGVNTDGNRTNTKLLIRKATPIQMLPDAIHHGKKEAFSDAVGLEWKDFIQHECKDAEFHDTYDSNIIPITNEMKFYQAIFRLLFDEDTVPPFHILPALWLPNQDWINTGIEPSARVLPNYNRS